MPGLAPIASRAAEFILIHKAPYFVDLASMSTNGASANLGHMHSGIQLNGEGHEHLEINGN